MIKRLGLFDAFREAMLNDPKGSRKDAFKRFLAIMESDPKYLATLAEDYFDRACANWKVEKIGDSHSLVGTAAVQRRTDVSATKRAETAKERDALAGKIAARVRQVIILDLPLSCGKKARDCTGAEIAREGGFWTEVARHMKPTEVLDKAMGEQELRDIRSRFDAKPRRGATSAEARAGA